MGEHIDGQWIAEDEVAKRLGIDREKIRAARPQLQQGEVSLEGKVIVWLRAAAGRVASQMGLQVDFGQPQKNAAGPAGDQAEEVTVDSKPGAGGYHFPNQHLVRVRRASGELVLVRVVDSRKYFPRLRNGQPMTLRARQSESGTWWVLVGREPRFPGMW